jgi:hypothetical protein
MKPKDKAEDLFVMFYERYPDGVYSPEEAKREAKHGANVVCDEVIKVFESQMPPLTANYWKEVKQEIKSL